MQHRTRIPPLSDTERHDLQRVVNLYGGVAGAARALEMPRYAIKGGLGQPPQHAGTIALLRAALDRIRPRLDAGAIAGRSA